MSIVIDASIYFDRLYRKYITFRKGFKHESGSFMMNPLSMALDYILYAATHIDALLRSYRFKVIYFNVNHRIDIRRRSPAKQKQLISRLANAFRDMSYIMNTSDISGIYTRYHEYFKESVKSYKIKDIDERRTGYDYDNDLPQMELSFIEKALIEQNHLTPDDIYYCNILILNMLRNCRVIYTETPGIDYLKYHKARFVRSSKWKFQRRKEIHAKKPSIEYSIYEYFTTTRRLPLIDCCQTNSYNMFIVTENPFELYMDGKMTIFPDESLLDDYAEVIDLLIMRKEESASDMDQYANYIDSIEPTEITEADIDIVVNSIIKRWVSMYSVIDLHKLKMIKKPHNRLKSTHITSTIGINDTLEIV